MAMRAKNFLKTFAEGETFKFISERVKMFIQQPF
jgi:hypothetical protein